jgi:hypothetical protein
MAFEKPGRDKATVLLGVLPIGAFGKFDSILMMMASLLHELRYVQNKCQNLYTCPRHDANLVPDGFLAVCRFFAFHSSGTGGITRGVNGSTSNSMVVTKTQCEF